MRENAHKKNMPKTGNEMKATNEMRQKCIAAHILSTWDTLSFCCAHFSSAASMATPAAFAAH